MIYRQIRHSTAFHCGNKEMQEDQWVEYFHKWNLDRPISQWEALLPQSLVWRIAHLTVKYIACGFVKWAKSITAAPLDILHLCLLAVKPWAQAQSTKMYAFSLKGTDEVSSGESLLKRRSRCMSSVNGPSSNAPQLRSLCAPTYPTERQRAVAYTCKSILPNLPPWQVIQGLICTSMLRYAMGIQMYITKSQTIDHLSAWHWGQRKEGVFSKWLPSFCP